jgi:hypothetical protein
MTATLLPSPEGACPLWTPPTQMWRGLLSAVRGALAAADGGVGLVRQVGLVGQNALGAASRGFWCRLLAQMWRRYLSAVRGALAAADGGDGQDGQNGQDGQKAPWCGKKR